MTKILLIIYVATVFLFTGALLVQQHKHNNIVKELIYQQSEDGFRLKALDAAIEQCFLERQEVQKALSACIGDGL